MDERMSTPVLVVGSGNAEFIIKLEGSFLRDVKYIVEYQDLIGGSGVNYTIRLLHAGIPAYPILNIGDDQFGNTIKRQILQGRRFTPFEKETRAFIESDQFFVKNMKTPRATIIVSGEERTIFSERVAVEDRFEEHLKSCLGRFRSDFPARGNTVMIGHIQGDNPEHGPGKAGGCTRCILSAFDNDTLIFANFGGSQIAMGADFWEEDLRKTGIFQLNLKEMKTFFARFGARLCLVDIIEWLKQRRITTVITLDKFGAIASYKDGREGMILAWPSEYAKIVDTTGAGDAFGAGLISRLKDKPRFTCREFYDAIEEARIWAAFACSQLGASSNCPDKKTLSRSRKAFDFDPVEVVSGPEARRILKVFDKM